MSTDNKNYINLISDIEVYQKDSDYLEFDKYADILLNIIKGTNGPFTLGVKGEWGNGKTSLLRLVEAKINDENKDKNKDKTEEEIQTVWFNAWQYEREEHILFPFLATIADSISNSEKLKELRGKIIQIAKSIPSALSVNFGPVSFNSEKAIENYTDLQNKRRCKNFTTYKEAFEDLELD